MRLLDELARLWNDTRSRLPRSAWSWPLVAAAAGALIVLAGTGPSEVSTVSNAAVAQESNKASNEAAPACEEQTWPYLSDACLQRSRPASAQSAQTPPSHVRVLNYDAAMARAAIGATPWAPRETARPPQARQKPAGKRETTHGADRSKTVTVRSDRRDRNGSRERVYHVPNEAYSAYGYAPRR